MKSQPCKIVQGSGYVPCPAEEATHLTLNIPGPTGSLTLPVQIKGRRKVTGNWTWNGNVEKPTLRPSVLTNGRRFLGGDPTDKANWPEFRCHSWINDGHAQFLSDCSHDLKNQTVELLDVQNSELSGR